MAGFVAAAMPLDPVWETLFLGQINLILLALILTDIWLVSRGSSWLAVGVCVGIAAAIRLTPAIFIAFFLLARRTRAAFVAAGTFVLLRPHRIPGRAACVQAVLGASFP